MFSSPWPALIASGIANSDLATPLVSKCWSPPSKLPQTICFPFGDQQIAETFSAGRSHCVFPVVISIILHWLLSNNMAVKLGSASGLGRKSVILRFQLKLLIGTDCPFYKKNRVELMKRLIVRHSKYLHYSWYRWRCKPTRYHLPSQLKVETRLLRNELVEQLFLKKL